jgi:hypothetical protein
MCKINFPPGLLNNSNKRAPLKQEEILKVILPL